VALTDPLWLSHEAGDRYLMDGKGHWTLAYYPILGCGKTEEVYDEPRALVECPKVYNGVQGIDIREVPLRYLKRKV
jgi:hypothetical protein